MVFRRVAPLVAVLVLAGCNGGTVDRHALTNDSATLDSVACEGAIVADGIARGRTYVFFAREQAEELQIQAANLADALARRPVATGLEARVRAKSRQAARVSAMIGRLHDRPNDRAAAAVVERSLKRFGGCP
jgi:hypothetical protein